MPGIESPPWASHPRGWFRASPEVTPMTRLEIAVRLLNGMGGMYLLADVKNAGDAERARQAELTINAAMVAAEMILKADSQGVKP